MKRWQRDVVGFSTAIPAAFLAIAIYELLGLHPFLSGIVVLIPLTWLVVPWMVTGKSLWRLLREGNSEESNGSI
jgi:hypothetical protein